MKDIVHFLHIGKTGGSAMKFALEKLRLTGRYELVLENHQATMLNTPIDRKVFFSLRHPVTRFVSGFYSRKRKGQPRYYSEWSGLERLVFEAFRSPNDLAEAAAQSSNRHHSLARSALTEVIHFKSTTHWLGDPATYQSHADRVLHISFLEDLEMSFDRLTKLLGLSGQAQLPVDAVLAHKSPVRKKMSQLSEVAIGFLNDWYSEDYRLYDRSRHLMLSRNA